MFGQVGGKKKRGSFTVLGELLTRIPFFPSCLGRVGPCLRWPQGVAVDGKLNLRRLCNGFVWDSCWLVSQTPRLFCLVAGGLWRQGKRCWTVCGELRARASVHYTLVRALFVLRSRSRNVLETLCWQLLQNRDQPNGLALTGLIS